ncbi:MAG: hypothetical protein NT175_07915 [Bacteroidetes bacterium]|nr:hypothetical protein [Bacteroidota bacterium]
MFLQVICRPLYAQVDINSPYSHFGLGEIYNNRTAFNMSMGGISFALSNPLYINYANPASYNGIDTTSFLFEGGLFGDFVKSSTETQTARLKNVSLGYILMGFPITKWWKNSIGLTPYSYLGYAVSEVKYLNNIGNISYNYEGYGGLNRVYWGHSFRLFRNFSAGINASYLFGKLDYDKVIHFPDSVYMESFRVSNNTRVNDFLFNFGFQYHLKLKKDLSITTGVVYNAATKLNANRDILAVTFFPGNDQVEYIKDTIVYKPGEKGTLNVPYSIGVGSVIQNGTQWLVGAEFFWQNWKKYSSYGHSDSLDNSMRISFGGQYKPFSEGVSKYWERIAYRFGFRFDKTYLKLRSNTISEFGVTFGVGLPLKGTMSTVNLGLEVGQGGTKNNGLIRENYFRFTIGIALYERWFIKSKFY